MNRGENPGNDNPGWKAQVNPGIFKRLAVNLKRVEQLSLKYWRMDNPAFKLVSSSDKVLFKASFEYFSLISDNWPVLEISLDFMGFMISIRTY